MPFFPCAHAGHAVWQQAVQQVVVQLHAQISMQKLQAQCPLGVIYVSACYAGHAREIVAMLSQALPQVQDWVGCAAHTVLAGDMDYGQTGAVAVMLPRLQTHDYQVFSGVTPWHAGQLVPHSVLVHGDASAALHTADMQLLQDQLGDARLTGGVCDLQGHHAQWAWSAGEAQHMPRSIGGGGVQVGGFSGVAFAAGVECIAVGMQGCKPMGASRTITSVDGDVVLELDGQPALEVFFSNVDWGDVFAQRNPDADAIWRKVQQTMIAMAAPGDYVQGACIAAQARVMRVAGIDLLRQGVVVQGTPQLGETMTPCQADEQAMRTDMRRACAQLWELLTAAALQPAASDAVAPMGRSICGAVYIRNQRRHAPARLPQVDAELQLIRHALGPIPLLGFTSSYEIDAGQLQDMSAQLLVFTQPLQALI